MANTSTAGTGGSAKPTKTEQNLFEEDDEFEEFPAEGKGEGQGDFWQKKAVYSLESSLSSSEWDVHGEDVGDRQLWEDNWDDDSVEDDFSCQLR